jgi:hypothetical protein
MACLALFECPAVWTQMLFDTPGAAAVTTAAHHLARHTVSVVLSMCAYASSAGICRTNHAVGAQLLAAARASLFVRAQARHVWHHVGNCRSVQLSV